MKRADLRRLAQARLADTKALLDAGQYSGAYYLCGYAIECAIKACIAKQTARYDFPDKDKAFKSYTHNPESLIVVAGLRAELQQEITTDAQFEVNWEVVIRWSEHSRYELRSRLEAEDLYRAVTDRRHGVLRWLRQHW